MPVPTVVSLTAHSPRGTEFVATARPPLSWRVQTTVAPWTQDRAELELRRGREVETAVVGEDSVRVPWPFEPLSSGEEASLRVRVSGSGGMVSDWSKPLRIRAGFWSPAVGAATPIGLAEPSEEAQPGLARTDSTPTVRSARPCSTQQPSAGTRCRSTAPTSTTTCSSRAGRRTPIGPCMTPPASAHCSGRDATRSGCGSLGAGRPSDSASGPARGGCTPTSPRSRSSCASTTSTGAGPTCCPTAHGAPAPDQSSLAASTQERSTMHGPRFPVGPSPASTTRVGGRPRGVRTSSRRRHGWRRRCAGSSACPYGR
jgi:hypothetical protein